MSLHSLGGKLPREHGAEVSGFPPPHALSQEKLSLPLLGPIMSLENEIMRPLLIIFLTT